jgi:transposase
MVNVGVDLHKTQFTVCARSREGEKYNEYPTTDLGYRMFLKDMAVFQEAGEEVRAAVESTGNTRHFKSRLEGAGIEVTAVNTLKFKVVNESVKKTDKHDAATIAEFLEKDMLPESQLCSEESEQYRRLLNAREALVRTEVTIKNQIHALLAAEGMEDVKRGELQSKIGRQRTLDALKQCKSGPAAQTLIKTIDSLEEDVKSIEKQLRALAKGDRMVELLMTVPGCGEICAWTIRAYTDDIRRFASPKKYAAYAGLVPWVQNSNETIHHGKITKRGPKKLRTAIVQVVMGLRRMAEKTQGWRLMQRYEAMKKNKGSGKTIIATARKLATIIWRMLTDDVEFDVSRMTDRELWLKSEGMSKRAKANADEAIEAREMLPVITNKKTVLTKPEAKKEKKTGVARKKKIKVG